MDKLKSQEMPTVFPKSHRKSTTSSMKMVWSHALSMVKPKMVIPALLFSRYVTDTIEAVFR